MVLKSTGIYIFLVVFKSFCQFVGEFYLRNAQTIKDLFEPFILKSERAEFDWDRRWERVCKQIFLIIFPNSKSVENCSRFNSKMAEFAERFNKPLETLFSNPLVIKVTLIG